MLTEQDILQFATDWTKWKGKHSFFRSVADLFGVDAHVVFYGQALENHSAQLRLIWGDPLDGPMIEQLQKNLEQQAEFCVDFIEPQFLYFCQLGQNEQQKFFLAIILPNKLSTTVEKTLFNYLQGGFQFFIRLTDRNRLLNLAYTDDVTGYFNQRKLTRDLNQLINDRREQQSIFSVLFIDIDHFKYVNDNHGHLIGSKLLLALAQTIAKTLRDDDLLYRYGGDEFVLILPRITYKQATVVGQRLIDLVKAEEFVFSDELKFNLSISIGVAQYPQDAKTREGILELADMMMYEAKKQGRGCVCSARALTTKGRVT